MLILGLFLTTLAWCSQTTSTPTEIKTVKVGVIAPLSWPAATYGEDTVNSYKFTFDKMKQEGKVKGHDVQFIYEDGKCSWKDAAAAAQKLITIDNVDMILGWVCSAETIAAAKVAQTYHIPLLSAASSSPAITKLWDGVRRFYSDINQANLIANYLNDHNSKNIAVIYEDTDYAVDFVKTLKSIYKWNVLLDEKVAASEKDITIITKQIWNQVKNIDDVVIVNGGTDTLFISMINKFDEEGTLKAFTGDWIGTDTLFSTSILDAVASKMEWFLGATLPDDRSKYSSTVANMMSDFNKKYTVKWVNFYLVLYQEAINLITDMFDAGNRTPQTIASYLKSINQSNPREWYFGKYYFKGTDAQWLQFVFKKIVNGKPEFVK